MPYAWFGILRRAMALTLAGVPVTPREPYEVPPDAPLLHRAYAANGIQLWEAELINGVVEELGSHLICHGDSEGWYIPRPLREPVYVDDAGWIGATGNLLSELRQLAPSLGIPLEEGLPSAATLDAIDNEEGEDGLEIDRLAWAILFDNARLAYAHGAILLFC
jgi:hypothetical protein